MKTLLLTFILLLSISSFAQKKSCNKKSNKFELNTHKCKIHKKNNVDNKTAKFISSKPHKKKCSFSKHYKIKELSNFPVILLSSK